MTDLIIKKNAPTIAELKARGAVLVDDSQPGQGFQEDATESPEYSLIEPDQLKRAQDAVPSAALQEKTEEFMSGNVDAVRKYRMKNQTELTEFIPGQLIHIGDFLTKLQTIRPDAFLAVNSYVGLRGLGFVGADGPFYSGTSLMDVDGNAGMMPEWSKLRIDAHGLPTKEAYRGWRTCLLTLISRGILTEAQCDDLFGKPSGPRASTWYRQLFIMRNNRCPDCRQEQCICLSHYDYLRADAYQYEIPSEVAAGKQQRIDTAPAPRIYVP